MIIGVCIRAKNEQKIICDWVKHYLNLGFDKIFIYDNLSVPSIEESLKENNLLQDNVSIKIDTFPHSNQPVIYQECLDENKDLDWLFLCDADEFLWLKKGTIKEFLSKFSPDTSTVLINWLVYGSSNLAKYDKNKTVFEQFTYREEYQHFWNNFVKSFIRPKLNDKIGNVHITYHPDFKTRDIYHNILDTENLNLCDNKDKNLGSNSDVLLVHYMTLDFESMNQKFYRNHNGSLIPKNDHKYSLEWYRTPQYGFLDNVQDRRMIKYCQ